MHIAGNHCYTLLMVTAMLQAETQKRFDSLRAEVDKRDADIRQLQRSLKEAEGLLVSISVTVFSLRLFSIWHW